MLTLKITPQTHVRATQGDRILFRIPKDKRHPASQKRVERLERYNQYKEDLRYLAEKGRLQIPTQGLSIEFFIPCPKSWQEWQKEVMHLKLHQARPDIDNLLKAFFDAILPEDKHIGQISVTKYWVNSPVGWIAVETSAPIVECIPFPKSKKLYISSLQQ